MAAIGGVAPGSIDFDELYMRVCEKLPFYARPLFIRVGSELEVTGTYTSLLLSWFGLPFIYTDERITFNKF